MSMGIIDLVGRGLGCEMCGIVSASRAIFSQPKFFSDHMHMAQRSHILEMKC